MSPIGRLLLRNLHRLKGDHGVLWINPPVDCPWGQISANPSTKLYLFCQDYSDWRLLRDAGAPAAFGVQPDGSGMPDCVVLTLPREKAKLRMLTHLCASLLGPRGRLLLAGEIRAGIKSSARHLSHWFQTVRHIDSARHCVLIEAEGANRSKPLDLDTYRSDWNLQEAGFDLKICSWPGVFAHGALDPGTRLLLENLPTVGIGKSVLDFGCGAGILGAAIMQRNPGVRLTLADSNALACRAATATLESNDSKARVVPSDGFSDIGGRFDLIVCNPPFHRDHQAAMTLTPALLGPVRNFLKPSGRFTLVANRHLPYRRWLDELFGTHTRSAANRGYQVLSAHQP